MKMNVKIIGIGGCGRNILNRLIDIGFDLDMVVYMDTAREVGPFKSDNFVQLGKSIFEGLGTGNDPNGGRVAAEMTEG